MPTWATPTYYAGRLDEAHRELPHRAQPEPGHRWRAVRIGVVLLQKGDPAAALGGDADRKRTRVWRLTGLSMAYHALGNKAESDAALAELIRKYEKDFGLHHRLRAGIPRRGRPRLRVAGKGGSSTTTRAWSAIAVNPLFANLHSDPRWLPFLRKHRQGPRAARGDQVRREGAEMRSCLCR